MKKSSIIDVCIMETPVSYSVVYKPHFGAWILEGILATYVYYLIENCTYYASPCQWKYFSFL